MSVTLRTKKLANNRFSYYLDYYDRGTRKKMTILTVGKDDDKKEKKLLAEKIRNQKALEIDYQGTGFIPEHMGKIEVINYCDNYVDQYTKADKKVISSAVNKFKTFLSIKKISLKITFKQLPEKTVYDFADYLNYDAGLSGSSPLNYFKKFKMIIKESKREKLLSYDFLDDFRFRSRVGNSDNNVKKNVLNEEEINILWQTECRNPEIKKAFLYACYTSLGYAEIVDLKWSHIKDNNVDTDRKKNNRRINNAVSERMMKALGERKDDNEYVFDLRNKNTGQPFTSNGVNAAIKDWIKRSGIDRHFTFYCGRHTFAIRLIHNGVNLKTIADAMGHSNTTITNKYLNHITDIKHQATSALL